LFAAAAPETGRAVMMNAAARANPVTPVRLFGEIWLFFDMGAKLRHKAALGKQRSTLNLREENIVNRAGKRLFCFGLGFSARALVPVAQAQGFTVAGTCRSAEKHAVLRAEGIDAFLYGPDTPLDPAALDGTTHLLTSVPPDAVGDPVIRDLKSRLAALDLDWAGYLSTTGVYGDRGGEWVDETSPLTPSTERGQRRLRAEQEWTALGLPLHIFRLAGIYGPDRNQLASLRSGKAKRIVKLGQIFSRIHVDDIAATLAASIAKPAPGTAYNVCDDEPAPPQDVVTYAAELLGVPSPPEIPFEDANLSPMAKSFYTERKRVSNTRIHEHLGITLRHPTYREGLRALRDAGE
jgi:nucleoside-diphosphate-sugar epimerase